MRMIVAHYHITGFMNIVVNLSRDGIISCLDFISTNEYTELVVVSKARVQPQLSLIGHHQLPTNPHAPPLKSQRVI
jgi:hypothetical protein